MEFNEWTPNDIARVVDLSPRGSLLSLVQYYGGSRRQVVDEVFGQAYSLGAGTAIVEYRYVDPDFRSEHSGFYSRTFRRYPSVAHRIHFFKEAPDEDLMTEVHAERFGDKTYLGYTVLRPLPGARIGRTMLTPAQDIISDISCQVKDNVNLFGEGLSVVGSPFMSQDSQLGVCAHMTLWVIGYYHHLAFGGSRFLPSEIAAMIPAEIGFGRRAPSGGLNISQMSAGCAALGRPPLVYACDRLPKNESIPRIVCRYLNSGMPVIVAAGRHAFVLVGYKRQQIGTPDERIQFIAQDDERGPYRLIRDFKHDLRGMWEYLVVPLPEKVFVPGESAEAIGRTRLTEGMRLSGTASANELLARFELGKADERGLAIRSTAIRSNRFKETLLERGVPRDVAALYRRMQLSRWIWVVEVLDRKARGDGEPSVLAEAVIDATDHGRDLHVLAMRYPDELWSWRPDSDEAGSRTLSKQPAYESVSRFVLDPPTPTPRSGGAVTQ
jgi:hypothetical protein